MIQVTIILNIYIYIYIYDNNYPNVSDLKITINKSENKWYYTDPNNPNKYNPNGYEEGLILDQKSASDFRHTNFYSKNIFQEIYAYPYQTLSINDENGHHIGHDLTTSTIFDLSGYSQPLFLIADTISPPVGYYMPYKSFSAELTDFGDTISQITVIGDNSLFSYYRKVEHSKYDETDNILFQNGVFSVINNDPLIKQFYLETFLEKTNCRNFKLSNLTISQADTISIETENSDNLLISNFGGENSYNIQIEAHNQIFNHFNIIIPQNSSHEIIVDWDSLETKKILIIVDNNMNGTINDTLFLENWYNQAGPFALHVFLEGSYNGTDMNTDLNPELLPLSQPYNDTLKWNYQGTESVASIPNGDIVDWVLLELRETDGDASTAIADSMIARKVVFLLKDGSIVDLDGESPIYFNNEITDNLYVVVYHRNHLPIMSSQALTKENNGYSWDFTTSADQAYGTNAQKNLGVVYGLYGGDSDANEVIDFDDKDLDWSNDVGKTGFYQSDLNLDKEVNNLDKNDIWEPNLGIASLLPWSCGHPMIDIRDGQAYNTVQIDSQCWMAKNLNIGTMINGSYNQANNGIIEKYCYDNNIANCKMYGGLYQWDEMMQYVVNEGTEGICPTGWHLPTDTEWKVLEMNLGMTSAQADSSGWRGTNEGGKLKKVGTIHWTSPNMGATNSSGFSALPGGNRYTQNDFFYKNLYSYFWLSSKEGSKSQFRHLSNTYAKIRRAKTDYVHFGFSVRCIKD